eukprot:CAMPEP_0198557512 /NCGR_PEP_ID=MMETSP1462-20131121/88792_1 /TAXON_ID=1333877 /ORGANISM="Brandtodinium nutriculum, Strain RCC3387" /LENGTH=263 /DNA_ID=CAMNT_0044288299 /DNA_START=84 /DNA_END=875 /DNA_ORIENTATION=-
MTAIQGDWSVSYWKDRYGSGRQSCMPNNPGADPRQSCDEGPARRSIRQHRFYITQTLKEVLRQGNWSSILDMGCGDGLMSRWFVRVESIRQYQGVDVSTDALQRARQRCWDVVEQDRAQAQPLTAALGKMRFNVYDGLRLPASVRNRRFHVGLSVGVVDNLVEEHVFSAYMSNLFFGPVLGAVLIFGGTHESDVDPRRPYYRPRQVRRWVEKNAKQFWEGPIALTNITKYMRLNARYAQDVPSLFYRRGTPSRSMPLFSGRRV